MSELIEKIRSKDVAMIITSVGGVLLAALLAYVLFKVLTNDLSHLNETLGGVDRSLQANTEVLRGNTEVLRSLQEKIK